VISQTHESYFELPPLTVAGDHLKAHLVGAAGAGMRSLSAVLAQAGWQLTGSDSAAGQSSQTIAIDRGHRCARIHSHLDVVIFSDAISGDNPERRKAERLGVPTLSYPAALGELMRQRRGIAVAGTHGKSTAAAMLAQILEAAGTDPTYVFGATRGDGRPGGRLGRGDWMIAEACEYRANFCHLQPEIALLLGIEPDHFDYYRSWDELESAFQQFVSGLLPGGCLLYHAACAISRRLAAEHSGRGESFGLSSSADWQAEVVGSGRGCYRFALRHRGAVLGQIQLAVPARHNVVNALAAAAAASHAGAEWPAIQAGLESFCGLSRRLEVVLDSPELAIVDDFAHLPTEIAAGLESIRSCYPGRRLWCVFQPHQASRTAHLLDELAESLQNADRVLVADIFRAREGAAKPGDVSSGDLAARVAARGAEVIAVHQDTEILPRLVEGLQVGDVLVTMGAGNIGKIAHGLAQRIRKNHTPE
jgi:UDP-N-acetylmuramate--alanine ligase